MATTATTQAGPVATGSVRAGGASSAASVDGKTYIVMFSEPSVALRNRALRSQGTQGLRASDAIPFGTKANGRAYMDMRSDNARSYRATLVAAQAQHQVSIEKTIGRSVTFSRTFQNAINGAVLTLSDREADLVRATPGVLSVVSSRTMYPDDDVSTRFIGADILWRGNNLRPPAPGFTYPTLSSLFGDLNQGTGYKGDGVVIGIIDTGYNSQSPSFQAADASGYAVTNPLGSGNYIGDCNVSSISLGGCNDKVIGVYDAYSRGLGKTGVNVEDTNGHGSHTASTAGGNARQGGILGFSANLSGIAPHANLSIFSIVSPGTGTASDVSELTAIEDAIEDGVVDVLNMSFGGCMEPNYWNDPVSLGFLAAQDANIFTALSAGNTRPVTTCARQAAQTPGTVGNAMPWVTTVAATTPPAGQASLQLSLTGPGKPPAATQGITLTEGTYDTPLAAPFPAGTPIVLSPQFDAGDPGSQNAPTHGADGCNAYPADTFKNAIALISRGTCGFAVKVPNAIAAGAVSVIIADNRVEGPFSPTVGPPSVGVSVFSVAQADGIALQKYLGTSSGVGAASLGFPSSRPSGQGDVLGDFSLIGPVLTPVPFDVIKPDIAAPGVGTLAAFNNAFMTAEGLIVSNNNPDIVAFDSGTSMASPHIAGAAALLVQARPDWTASEIKSALMMTAVTNGVTKADGKTPAGVYDVGAGRVQVDKAAAAGLVLTENGDNFRAADPTKGGDVSTFNIASMQNFSCAGSCSFTRTFRSTQKTTTTWTTGTTGSLADKITIEPATFTVPAGGTVKLTVTVNTRSLIAGGSYSTGSVLLFAPDPLPGYQSLADLHLPVSVAVPAPSVATSANVVNINLNGKATGSATLDFANIGGGSMTFAPKAGGVAPLVWANQKDNSAYYNFTSTHYLNPGQGDLDQFLADDFVVSGNAVDLGLIVATGHAVHSLASFGTGLGVHWRIYPDNNGVPGTQAAWSYDATAGSPGVSVAGDVISLDLAAAQQATGLAAGRYWLSVYPDLPCNDKGDGKGCTEGWSWDTSWYGNDTSWAYTSSDPNATWSTGGTSGYGPGLAMAVVTRVACANPPSWLTLTPNGGAGLVTAGSPATVTFSAAKAGYAPNASASSYVCFGTSYQDPILSTQIPKNTIAVQVNAKN
ncbi:MAG: S8 family serine peptidase [Rudaea sp.]|uniref:S8 family serine peptidase n=1 Tax=Rudaea sp. TaxID=2136325 RepID=UPI001AC30EAA|nr:S8 family serine peptidase [Rudaea sp.]MBN8888562.1 S8 family serine peptidase [Rudaea sp.]